MTRHTHSIIYKACADLFAAGAGVRGIRFFPVFFLISLFAMPVFANMATTTWGVGKNQTPANWGALQLVSTYDSADGSASPHNIKVQTTGLTLASVNTAINTTIPDIQTNLALKLDAPTSVWNSSVNTILLAAPNDFTTLYWKKNGLMTYDSGYDITQNVVYDPSQVDVWGGARMLVGESTGKNGEFAVSEGPISFNNISLPSTGTYCLNIGPTGDVGTTGSACSTGGGGVPSGGMPHIETGNLTQATLMTKGMTVGQTYGFSNPNGVDGQSYQIVSLPCGGNIGTVDVQQGIVTMLKDETFTGLATEANPPHAAAPNTNIYSFISRHSGSGGITCVLLDSGGGGGTPSVPWATTTTGGIVKLGADPDSNAPADTTTLVAQTGAFYPIQVNSNNQMFVRVSDSSGGGGSNFMPFIGYNQYGVRRFADFIVENDAIGLSIFGIAIQGGIFQGMGVRDETTNNVSGWLYPSWDKAQYLIDSNGAKCRVDGGKTFGFTTATSGGGCLLAPNSTATTCTSPVYSFDDSINVLCPEGGGVTRVRMAGAETNVSDPAGPIVNLGRASGTEFGVAKLGSGDGMEGSMEQATIGGKNIPVQANELGNMFVNIVEPYVPQDCSGKWHDVSPSFHHWECAQFGNVVTASFYIKNIAGGWEPGKNIHLGTSDHSIFRGLGGNTRPYKYCSYNLTGDQENPGLYAKCHQINGHAFIVMGELVSNLFFVHFDYDWEENAGKCDMVITCDYVLNP